MPEPQLVHRETVDAVTTLTLDSPRNRNALSARLRAQLAGQLEAAIADDATRVVVLSHTGSVFCSGMDLTEVRGTGVDGTGVDGTGVDGTGVDGTGGAASGLRELAALLRTLWSSPKPVLARVGGPARAGGIGLLAACDLAVAAETATFAFSEVRIGVVPAVISAVVRRRMSARAVHELFLTGEVFDAARAAATGLITAAVPAADLDREVARYAALLRQGAPGALAATKRLMDVPPDAEPGAGLDRLTELSVSSFASDEAAEGMRAFAEKRAPRWA